MIITVDLAAPEPLYLQIAEGVVRALATGEVRPGGRLPPGRDLAATLDVSLETVQHAYRTLVERGIAESRVGRGTRIRDDVDPETLAIGSAVDLLVEAARRVDMPLDRLLDAVARRFTDPAIG